MQKVKLDNLESDYYLKISNRGESMASYTKEEIKEQIDVLTFASLDNLRDIIHQNAIAKGFWENPMSVKRAWLLIITEISESYEAYRANRFATNRDIKAWHFLSSGKFVNVSDDEEGKNYVFEKSIKDTFEDEIADVIIRTLDFCGYYKDYIGSIDEHIVYRLDNESESTYNDLNLLASHLYVDNDGEYDEDISNIILFALSIANYEFSEINLNELWVTPIDFLLEIINFAKKYDVDIHSHVLAKHLYNTTREYKHGKSF